jgi:5-methylcytosine-specific restriction endonuclease McrA
LVLNASYEPLCVVPVRRALILVLNHKADCLEEAGSILRSATVTLPVPSVVRLNRFVRIPYQDQVPLTRRALFARDGGRCVYCGKAATSIDHVIPRSRGGRHAWDNVVSACRRCNHVKADRYLSDLGWPMRRTPAPPTGLAWRIIGTGFRDPRWEPYLAPYGATDYESAAHAALRADRHEPFRHQDRHEHFAHTPHVVVQLPHSQPVEQARSA